MISSRMAVAGGIVALFGVSGGMAYAAIPADDGTITGCYTKTTTAPEPQGSLRVVDSESQCRRQEIALLWSQQGPSGLEGPAGPQGEPGIPGPAGEAETYLWFASQQPALIFLTGDNPEATIVSVDLPAGSYRIDGRLVAYTLGWNTEVNCKLGGIPAAGLASRTGEDGAESSHQLEMTVALNHAGGPIELTCRGAPVEVYSATLVATQVTAVNPGTP